MSERVQTGVREATAAEFARRLAAVQDASLPWLVAGLEGTIAGYAYATRWRERRGYRFSAEVTGYVTP